VGDGTPQGSGFGRFAKEAHGRLHPGSWRNELPWFAGELGRNLAAQRILVYEHHLDRDDSWTAVRLHSWHTASVRDYEPLPGIIRSDHLPDIRGLLASETVATLHEEDGTSIVLAPVETHDEQWGFLAGISQGGNPHGTHALEVGLSFGASILGSVISQSLLAAQLRDSERLRTLQWQLATASTGDQPWADSLHALLELLCGSAGFDSGIVTAVREGESTVLTRTGGHPNEYEICSACRNRLEDGTDPVYLGSDDLVHAGPCEFERRGYHLIVSIPLLHHDAPVGLMQFGSTRWSRATSSITTALETAAAEIGMLLAQIESDRQLRVAVERQRLAAEAGRVGIWEYREGGAHVVLEAPAHELLQVSTGGVLTADEAFSHLDRSSFDAIVRWLHDSSTADVPLFVEAGIPRTSRWLLIRARRVARDPGEDTVVGTIVDITDQRAAREAADALTRAQSDFMARMSHEFRTPLHAIGGHLQLLRRMKADQPGEAHPVQDSLEGIASASRHLLDLVEHILDQNRLESGAVGIEAQPTDLNELMHDLTETARVLGEATRTRSHSNVTPEAPSTILMDGPRVRQVLYNLLANAVKYAAGGSVTLDVKWTAGTHDRSARLRFAVLDDGPGIPAEERGRVFLPYRQSAKGDSGGSGLGLAISQELVRLMGSRIWLASIRGRGSVFWFTINCSAVPADDSDAAVNGLSEGALSAQTIQSLLEPARIGDLDLLRARIADIGGEEADQASALLAKVDMLASRYRVREIQSLLERALGTGDG
jgi:signal transduction histidine kinase